MSDRTSALVTFQGAYDLASGVWPLLSMRTFEWVTGPKREDWLVRMVGLLAAVIGGALLLAQRRGETDALGPLAAGSAVAFGAVDVVGTASGRLRPVYLGDAVLQALFVGTWLARGARRHRRSSVGPRL